LTFDDGNLTQKELYYPILKKYGFHATFYIVGNWIDRPGKLSIADIHELSRDGNEIGSHGMSHRSLQKLSTAQVIWELEKSRELLAPYNVRSFAYPDGLYDTRIADLTSRYYGSARVYSTVVSFNAPQSLNRFELSSFPIEGRYSGRLKSTDPDHVLAHIDLHQEGWFIIAMHGKTSIRAGFREAIRGMDFSRERLLGYIEDFRARVSFGNPLGALERFCERLSSANVVVDTVSGVLDRLG
jgi:peptidoglycan/xylan/chitin deacetylase (PgdA/CDA1 family)